MSKYVFIDSRIRGKEEEKLKELGYILIKLPKSENVYEEISSHTDIFVSKIENTIVIEKDMYESLKRESKEFGKLLEENREKNKYEIIKSEKSLGKTYPDDIALNVSFLGRFAIHNFKHTDKVLLRKIEEFGYEKISINQGYSNCSIAKLGNSLCITADKSVKETLESFGIEVFLFEGSARNIKLLNGEKFSNLSGFIGGCTALLEDNFVVFGDLELIDKENKLREFINSKNINIIDFEKMQVVDYGSLIAVDI